VDLEIRHLKLVAAVAEEGSVTRAGSRLHLTQSALSHQLRDAEEMLGTPLFRRLSRKMVLTPAGERLLRSARTVLDELDRAEKEISRASGEPAGLLRLCTQCYTCYHWLPARMKLFQEEFPGVEFQVVVEDTPNPIPALLEGRLDLALVNSQPRDPRIVYTPLFEDELLAVLPPNHPKASRPFLEPEDFADETVIIYPPKEESTLLLRFLTPAGIRPRRVREVMLTEAIIELVKAGLGIGMIARWAIEPQLRAGTVRALPMGRAGFRRTWCAATLRSRDVPGYVHEFVDLLVKHPLSCTLTGKPRRLRRARTRASLQPAEIFPAERKAPRRAS
jgi:LysR family transcriptional regulator for metE and metH